MHRAINASFSVKTDYSVYFTRGVFSPENSLLASVLSPLGPRPRVFFALDRGVADAFPSLEQACADWAQVHAHLMGPPVCLPGGEALKNDYRQLMGLMDQMLESHLCRHSVVIAIGGGSFLDAVGLACSLLHRGVRLLRMPSTTLSQNDAGIGVKNGMNLHGVKNGIGTFAPPVAVINDFSLLDGLSDDQWRDGIAEAFKVALIKDAGFYRDLCAMAPALGRRDASAMEDLIQRCAALHLDHISTSGDPFENGSARPLDFGHWSAHKLESQSNYRLRHGQAVAVGIALDTRIAELLEFVPPGTAEELSTALRTCGFDLNPPELHQRLGDGSLQLLQGLEMFREHLGGSLTLSLPCPVGRITELHELEAGLVEKAVSHLTPPSCV
jgi:3-dehydroquinate synthase